MGGKTGTTTQSVSIPKEVLARYNSVNAQAQSVAGTPFQQYSTDPNAFVAPINQQQYAGIGGINRAANMAQPSIAYAQQGFTPEGFQQGVAGYMNPYLQNAIGSTVAQMQNVNQQQQNQLAGNAIQQGAFGGDRAGIARNNLINQQNLALGQTVGQMANQGYQQSAQNYMQGLGQIGQLGLQGQQAALQGAQAQLGAGTLEQQTQQAGQTALYNQFLQQQAYPFQVAQFLANIAMGTGANSGSTTTTTQPMPFFSDRKLKKDVERIGESDDGLPIYKFKYKEDPYQSTRIGFMADEVEKKHPDAVGLAGGYKTVDYDRATKADGGMSSEGGAVLPQHHGLGFAGGGDVAGALNAMNAMQANMPVTTGGVDPGVVAQAQAIAPQPVIPESVYKAPGYNVFADPKYQPDLSGGNKNGNKNGGGGHHDEEHNYNPNKNPNRGNDNRSNPFSNNSYSVDPNGVMYDNNGRPTGDYDPTQGGAFAEGGRAGYNLQGGVNDPYDPYSIQNILNRQKTSYAELEGSHVPVSRKLSGGIGKGSRLPEANLPVGKLQVASAPPPQMESGLEQGMSAMEKAQKISEMFSKDASGKPGMGTKILDWLKSSGSEQPAEGTEQPQAAPQAATAAKKTAEMGEEYDPFADLAQFANRGGLMRQHHALTGSAQNSEDDPNGTAVDELYSGQNDPTKRDIIAKLDKSKLPTAGNAPTPTSQTGLGVDTALSLGKFILPFFLKSGGRAGYDNGGLTEEEIMKRAAYDPTLLGTKVRGGLDPKAQFLRASDVKQTATDVPDAYSRELHPAVAPRFRFYEGRMEGRGNELTPTDLFRTPERSAGLDLTMPAGAPRAKPGHSGHNYGLAVDYSGLNEGNLADSREIAKQAGLTVGADFSNPDMPHIQYSKGSFGGLHGKGIVELPEGSKDRSFRGIVPEEATREYYANADLPARGASDAGLAGGEVPSTNRIGQRVGLTGVTPSGAYTEASQQTGPIGKLAKGVFGEDFPTSENIWVPALAGVGAMLSSKSPFFLPALGEGLLGATSAYSGLQKQQAGIAKDLAEVPLTEASTGLTEAKIEDAYMRIAKDSLFTLPNGELYVTGINPDGTRGLVRERDVRRMIKEGKLVVDPRGVRFKEPQSTDIPPDLRKAQPQAGLAGAGAEPRIAEAGAPPAGTEPPATTPPTVQGTGVGGAESKTFALDPADKKLIDSEIEASDSASFNAATEGAASAKKFEEINASGATADKAIADMIDYAGELSVRQQDGLLAPGALGAASKQIATVIQDIANRFGLKTPFDPQAIGNEEQMQKAFERLVKEAGDSSNFKAQAALEQFSDLFPGRNQTFEGAAGNSAKVLKDMMRNRDMRNMASEWLKYVRENGNLAPRNEVYTGRNFEKWFNDKYGDIYAQDENALKKMFLTPITGDNGQPITDPTGAPMTYMRYIYKVASNPKLTDEQRLQIRDNVAEEFGKNVIRYFPMLKQY